MPEQDHDEAWEAEQREIVQSQIQTPNPNDIIERRAELRDSGMDPDQIDSVIRRETLQHEAPQRSEWYRQSQAEHEQDLRTPQWFPLTGDGLVTHRIIAEGPFNGPDIGTELAMARYRDHQHAENIMPQNETDTKLQAWLQALLNKDQEQKQHASLPLTETRNQTLEQAKEEQTRQRSLSI
jgi:hypothetical protein